MRRQVLQAIKLLISWPFATRHLLASCSAQSLCRLPCAAWGVFFKYTSTIFCLLVRSPTVAYF